MPAGRQKKGVVYGLCDESGVVFYVGQTVNLKSRMADYRSGRCHGNAMLLDKIAQHGVHHVILHENPENLTVSEFAEISARAGLVNLIRSEEEALRYAKSTKKWVVPGVQLPSTAYMLHMRNAFGKSCKWLKIKLNSMSEIERFDTEKRFAVAFLGTSIGKSCSKWMEATDGRA